MNHCDVRGSEAYCGESAHCLLCEQTGASQIAGVNLRTIRNNIDGSFDLRELASKLRKNREHDPISKLVLVENTFNGKIVPQSWLEELVSLCKVRNLKMHMDGARLWNASIASGVPAAKIVSGFDSVSFCISKGLGAPVGSLLCGTKAFVANARRIRKVLGGGMRQVGVLAAAGLVAFKHIPNLANDHKRAFALASAINEIRSSRYSVNLSTVQTNMVFVDIDSKVANTETFVHCLQDGDEDKVIVKCIALSDSQVRFVFSREITDHGLALAIEKITRVIRRLDP
ncbi:L-allo-threonine aldolase, partial [Eufriesea mexicana]